jgi:hypothetical protein
MNGFAQRSLIVAAAVAISAILCLASLGSAIERVATNAVAANEAPSAPKCCVWYHGRRGAAARAASMRCGRLSLVRRNVESPALGRGEQFVLIIGVGF